MEDSFNARVGKIFGSLNSSSSSSSPAALSSLWSLTDDEVERKQWNRREELEKDIEEEEDEDEDKDKDKESQQSEKPDDFNDEEWELKSSIGLDCTLDFEEEEDEYDKVAVEDEDRVYMKVVEEAEQGPLNPKSILKRKENHSQDSESKPSKRVRFDPDCVHDHRDEPVQISPRDDESIPDYLRNPSRYTRYTFDSSSDLDDSSNRQAYMDFLRKKREKEEVDAPVTFIPRKKGGDTTAMVDSCTQLVQQVGIGALVAAAEETSVCAMEEDDQLPSHNTKPARKYRLKPVSESQD